MTTNRMEEPLIQVQHLVKSFGDLQVLKDINVDIYKGDVVCVIGPSGSGKSTFLRCLNRLEEPTGGAILFEGTDITNPKTDIDKHRQKMGMVFQQFNLFPHMNILKNLTIAPVKLQGRSQQEAEAEAMRLLERVGLADRAVILREGHIIGEIQKEDITENALLMAANGEGEHVSCQK